MRPAVPEPGLTINPHPIAQSKTTHDFRRHENIIRGLNEIAFRVAQKAETFARNLDDAVAQFWLALELTILGRTGRLILAGTLVVISRTSFGPSGADPAPVCLRHNLICRTIEIAALLIATEPMFILVLGWLMGQQKISRLSALGLALGIAGVAILTGAELTHGSSLLGLLAVLLGSLSWAAGVVISPRVNLPFDALGRTALPTICGAAMLLIAAGVTGEFQATHWASISLRSILGLAYLITFGSVMAFTAYTWLLQQCPPALVATHTYANPVVAVLLGWLLAGEPLSIRVVLASVAILGAIVLIRRGENTAAGCTTPELQAAGNKLAAAVRRAS